jgi:hypothetical protein
MGKKKPSFEITAIFHAASGGKVAIPDWCVVYPKWRAEHAKRRAARKAKGSSNGRR